jgi:hypothetical protein
MSTVRLVLAPDSVRADLTAETAARIAADAAIIASGAAPANVGIAPVIATGATAARTVAVRAGDTVNAKDFEAVADVGYTYPNTWTKNTNDTAALQAAINACQSRGGGTVFCPSGRYCIESVVLKTGVMLRGELSPTPGAGTVFYSEQASGGIVLLESGSNAFDVGGVQGIKFVAKNQGVWAVKQGTTAYVVNSVFSDLIQITSHGLNFSVYFQGCTIERILSKGTCDQILLLAGNWNRITDIDKEAGVECPFGGGHTGTTAEPYVDVTSHPSAGSDPQSTGNVFDGVLVEQNVSSNKPLVRFAHTQHTVLRKFWPEPATATNGYGIEISDSTNFHIRGSKMVLDATYLKMKVSSNSTVVVDVADINSTDTNLAACVTVDSSSHLYVEKLFSRRNSDLRPLAGNVTIGSATPASLLSSPDGVTLLDSRNPSSGTNILLNSSFESGMFGWTAAGTAVATTLEASELLKDSLQIHVTGTGNLSVAQNARVKAGQIYTVSAWIKVTGTTNCVALPTGPGTATAMNRVYSGQGWCLASCTFRAASDNNSAPFGVTINGADGTTMVYIDEVMVVPGRRAADSGLRTADLQLGQASNVRTLGNGSSAPGTGTWRQGDIVLNAAPGNSSGVPVGWVCVVAGSPGTWRAFGVTT